MMKNILIVDDNLENRYLLRALLEGHGFDVVEATDGAQALKKSRERAPHAVVTDLLMPGMDGFSLCREWTRDETLKRIPFVVYTATYTDPKDRELALDLGAAAFIIKPADPEELLRAIVSAIDNAEHAPPAQPTVRDSDFYERYAQRLQQKLDRKLGRLAVADRNLAEYITRCEAILDTTSNAVVSMDPDFCIRTWNFRAEELFGYKEEEVLNHSFKMLIPPDKINDAKQRLQAAREEKKTVRFETRQIFNKSGEPMDLEVALSYLGPKIGYVVMISDLTALHRAAEEKKRLEEQLALSQRMESIGLLAGGVAHDFNNLLTVILYHAESIEGDARLDDMFRAPVKCILEAGERAASLTGQLLAFSRKRAVKPDVMDLNDTVRAMGTMLKRLIGENINLKIELADALGRIEADKSQVEQVILNLSVNAKDAMQNGGKLTLRTETLVIGDMEAGTYPSMKPGRYVVLTVTDTGIGMNEETRARIFDPFFTTKPYGKGTGLGMAIVYGIVRQSNGFISIFSEPGHGTTIKIFLPSVDLQLTSRTPLSVLEDIRAKGETILVVEDEEMVRQIARQILMRVGYRVLEAAAADQALACAEETKEPIHLLLTDLIMPGMNGRDLAARMLLTRPEMKVVFTSGYTDDTVARHGILDPGVTLVEKPFSVRSLSAAIRAVLDGKEPGGIGRGR